MDNARELSGRVECYRDGRGGKKKKIKSMQGHPRGYSVAFGGPSHCVSTIIALINTSTFATIAFVVVVVNQVKSSFSPAIAYYNIIDERRPPEPQKHISHRPIFRFSTFNYPVIFPSIPYRHPSLSSRSRHPPCHRHYPALQSPYQLRTTPLQATP